MSVFNCFICSLNQCLFDRIECLNIKVYKCSTPDLTNKNSFHSFEVVDRDSETEFQVVDKMCKITSEERLSIFLIRLLLNHDNFGVVSSESLFLNITAWFIV